MKVCGIIAEYNPFHNGHKYHIEKSREITGADCIAVVMSASFVQRGEVSVYSKHARAEAAIQGGADIVFELPAYFSLQSASGFAKGATGILQAAKADYVSFGAECCDLEKLKNAARFLSDEPDDFREKLKKNLKHGYSFARARAEALRNLNHIDCADIISSPNNILAIEYLNAIQNTNIIPIAVERQKVIHDSDTPNGDFASASHIRNALRQGNDVSEFMPFDIDEKPLFTEDFEDLILYAVRLCGNEISEMIPDCGDGICERILSSKATSLNALLESVKTKRFSMSRIKRVLMNILIENTLPQSLAPSYLRVLALNKRGAEYLKEIKKDASLPIVTKPASYKENDPIWDLEMRASKIRAIKAQTKTEDIAISPVVVK
ncbi:MAG: nucleotidyltransferase family protein [Clostridia bacterium]|nr:nucleotidyltransferase family protein [Clostridia bacterium]